MVSYLHCDGTVSREKSFHIHVTYEQYEKYKCVEDYLYTLTTKNDAGNNSNKANSNLNCCNRIVAISSSYKDTQIISSSQLITLCHVYICLQEKQLSLSDHEMKQN